MSSVSLMWGVQAAVERCTSFLQEGARNYPKQNYVCTSEQRLLVPMRIHPHCLVPYFQISEIGFHINMRHVSEGIGVCFLLAGFSVSSTNHRVSCISDVSFKFLVVIFYLGFCGAIWFWSTD